MQLRIDWLDVIQPVIPQSKQVVQNNKDLEAAKQLCEGAWKAAQGAHAIFVEVPTGSQSARAMTSYGVCVGVLGALRTSGVPFFEVSPNEVKMASVGKITAKKSEIIKWAHQLYPQANWPTYKSNGTMKISEAKAEHMADAIAAIYAGIACNSFQQMLSFMKTA